MTKTLGLAKQSQRQRCATQPCDRVAPDRHPDLEPAIAGERIEYLAAAFEVRRIRHRWDAGSQRFQMVATLRRMVEMCSR
jgi:hypothetical protein